MTSNIGSHLIQEKLGSSGTEIGGNELEDLKDQIFELMRKTIRPEFLNRVDELIMFAPLNNDEIKDIVKLQIARIKNKLAKNNIDIEATGAAVELISSIGFDPQFGARPIKRIIQREILNKLSKEILAGRITGSQKIIIDRRNNELVLMN